MRQSYTSYLKNDTPTLARFYEGKRVWLSGHTGFKGSWLTEWLLLLGATVHGYALTPLTTPSLFNQLRLEQEEKLEHQVADIRHFDALKNSLEQFQPEVVFHLAAQPLVRRSYKDPLETYQTNVMGTIHLLEALRVLAPSWGHDVSVVLITTDKCYRNEEKGVPFQEQDPLGGKDPYSSSKAMDELVIEAYRSSYFGPSSPLHLASVRAGNVLGGGDWAEDRILPDAIGALQKGEAIPVRNPQATRPWQHVLEPLSGYLWLAATMQNDPSLATAFNFGPSSGSHASVADLIEEVLLHWPGDWKDLRELPEQRTSSTPAEANYLSLKIEKAARLLRWKPLWNFSETIQQTMLWYRFAEEQKQLPASFLKAESCSTQASDNLVAFTQAQIAHYSRFAHQEGVLWAQ